MNKVVVVSLLFVMAIVGYGIWYVNVAKPPLTAEPNTNGVMSGEQKSESRVIETTELPDSYEAYSTAAEAYTNLLKDVLLYRDPEPTPRLQEIADAVTPSLTSIAPSDSCTMIGAFTHGSNEGQIVLSQLYRGEEFFLTRDLGMYERRGYLSERDTSNNNISGPSGQSIEKITNTEWSCDEATLQELIATETDPFGKLDEQPVITDMLIISY